MPYEVRPLHSLGVSGQGSKQRIRAGSPKRKLEQMKGRRIRISRTAGGRVTFGSNMGSM